MDHHNHNKQISPAESEVIVKAAYADGVITIELKDKEGKVVELENSHEKEMHLIMASADLQKYYHGHPVKKEDGIYTLQNKLADNEYKVFVDIAPKRLSYTVFPITLHVGRAYHHRGINDLSVSTDYVQKVEGHTVELKINTFKAGEEMSLLFDIKDEIPEPYLGALGHVVVVDENAEKFIHVHPTAKDKTQFDTILTQAGKYKIWAEFQFNGKVLVYSFVIEVI